MRMNKLAFFILMLSGAVVSAQTIGNLNLLTTDGLHGTPRFQAMGGAFTALGNDFSSIHLNPAGASVFRKDNFGLSLGLQNQTDEARFLDGRDHNENFNLLFENIGLVKKFGNDVPLTFAVSYNKLADFNSEFSVNGTNLYQQEDNGSAIGFTLGEYWLSGVEDLTINEMENFGFFEEASAAAATVLLVDSIGAYVQDYYPDDASLVNYSFSESGSRSEALFSLGSQVEDKVFFGLAVGIPNLSYSNASALTEGGFADSSFISQYTLNQWNDVYANGVNIKLGAIVKPIQWLRLGASYQSPTWYRVSETYSLNVDATAFNSESYMGTEYIFDDIRYSVTTPSIFRGGAAAIFAQRAVISVDYEYMNASNLSLESRDGVDYSGAEALFQTLTDATSTFKAGLEYRIGPTYLRGGYRIRQSNFSEPGDFVSDRSTYSLGFGYANRNFGVDLSYAVTNYTYNYVVHPYLGDRLDGNGVVNRERTLASDEIIKGNVALGVSFKF